MSDCENWVNRAARCPLAAEGFEPYHKWIPVSTKIASGSEQVRMLLCGVCFHEVNLKEAFTHRRCFKDKAKSIV